MDNIDTVDTGTDEVSYDRMPNYLIAADNHDAADGDFSLADIAKSIAGGVAGAAIGQAAIPIPVLGAAVGAAVGALTAESDGNYAKASLISGANSFYNSGVAINNWFGGDAEARDNRESMAAIDDNLAEYYDEHKGLADISGLIAGSFIPGTVALGAYSKATKALGMMKEGSLGANMSGASGLLIPTQEKALAAAIKDITSSNATYSVLNQNTFKALAAGFGEQAIQAAIFETAVTATMFKSPILEEMDASDLGKHILFAAVLGGGIGGAVEGLRSYGAIKQAKIGADADLINYTHISELPDGASIDEKIIMFSDNKFNTPAVTTELESKYGTRPDRLLEGKINALDNALREEYHKLALGDTVVGNTMADLHHLHGNVEDVGKAVLGLRSATRLRETSAEERALSTTAKKMADGTATKEEIDAFTTQSTKYLKVWGEDAGVVSEDIPHQLALGDKLRKGQEIKITARGVKVGDGNAYKFAVDKPLDVFSDSTEAWQARYLWALHSPALKDGQVVHITDVPLMEKLYHESAAAMPTKGFNIKLADGSVQKILDRESLLTKIEEAKQRIVGSLHKASQNGGVISDPIAAELKLKELTGVHFAVSKNDDGRALAWTYTGDSNARRDIFISSKHLTTTPLARLVQALKHEEGHNAWNLVTHTNILGKQHLDDILNEARRASKTIRPEHWKQAQRSGDYSYVDDPHELMADMFAFASHRSRADIEKIAPTFASQLYHHVNPIPEELVNAIKLSSQKLSSHEIAARVNARVGYIEQTKYSANLEDDVFALQSSAKEHYAKLKDSVADTKSRLRLPNNPYDILLQPQHIKLGYDTKAVADIDGNVLEGIAAIKQKQVIYRNAVQNVFNNLAGGHASDFFRMPEDITMKANSFGAGQGGISFANGNYGTPASFFERIGQATHNLLQRNTAAVHSQLEPILNQIRNDLPSALELSTIMNRVRAAGKEKYVLSDDGESLVLRGQKAYDDAIANGANPKKLKPYTKSDPTIEDEIFIKRDSVREFIGKHIEINGIRILHLKNIRATQGLSHDVDHNTFYAPPVNPRDYPHVAFVVDDTITGTGHVSMIHAASQTELDQMIARVPARYTTITKGASERWHKAYGDYEADNALHENYIDTSKTSTGSSASFFPQTDPAKIVDDLMKWHTEKERQVVREGVSLLYSKEFAEFRRLGAQYTDLATSRYGKLSNLKIAEEVVHNPYVDYIKTALDVQKSADARIWTDINTKLDSKVSEIWSRITGTISKSKSSDELSLVNEAMREAGINTAHYDASMDALANHAIPKGQLSELVQRSNALLATLTLRMDFLNSVNNTVGGAVLGGTEFQAVIRAIKEGNEEGAGALAALAHIKIPGTGDSILAPKKLISEAYKNWFNPAIRKRYIDAGFTTRHTAEYHAILDDLTVRANDTASSLGGRIESTYAKIMQFGDKAERFTGNKFAEEFTRFISADVMRQMTDLAVAHAGMDAKLADAYIGTFVNRVNGNYLASQRPLAFQGPIGQAIGLFQTYQFNFLQQMFRHVADGQGKNAAIMLGLQGTIYGMNGLPAFNAINTHLIGSLPGNTNHQDISSFVYGEANKDIADWLMYGAASNVLGLFSPDLKTNLYTRGDINPRHLTILPTTLSDIPILNASSKFFGNLKETVSKLTPNVLAGDPASAWTTIMQGLEHNGVNRPLAGLAQAMEAFGNPELRSFSTTGNGSLSASNDLLTLTNFGRIMGGKPMDEAIAIDAGFRNTVYQAKDSDKRKELGEQIRTTVIGGRHPDPEQITEFAHAYAKAGGKQQNFNKFFANVYKSANVAQANILANNLKSPYAKKMQEIMGGSEFRDFNSSDGSTEQE